MNWVTQWAFITSRCAQIVTGSFAFFLRTSTLDNNSTSNAEAPTNSTTTAFRTTTAVSCTTDEKYPSFYDVMGIRHPKHVPSTCTGCLIYRLSVAMGLIQLWRQIPVIKRWLGHRGVWVFLMWSWRTSCTIAVVRYSIQRKFEYLFEPNIILIIYRC